jgi:hypothetical protein
VKRDWDLIKAILIHIETELDPQHVRLESIAGADATAVAEHTQLLIDAGFIDGVVAYAGSEASVRVRGLKPRGHAFVELAADDESWNAAKEIAGPEADSMSPADFTDLLKAVRDGRRRR